MSEAKRLSVLLLDDGELDDIQEMLEPLGVEFGRVRGGAIVPDSAPPRRLLVSTPRRIQAVRDFREDLDGEEPPIRIVVVQGDSLTLRSKLREVGFDYIVRRPVHPEALRLLLLHCLYRGEERRREPRVSVGSEISFRSGLLHRRATLADLSIGGCRLLSSYGLQSNKRVRLYFPESVGGAAQALTVTGRVLRMACEGDHYVAAVQFEGLQSEQRQELEWIIEAHGRGPASLDEVPEEREDPRVDPLGPSLREVNRSQRADPRSEPAAELAPAENPAAEPPAAFQEPLPEPAAEREPIDVPEIPDAVDEGFELGSPTDMQSVDLEIDLRLGGATDPDAETQPDLAGGDLDPDAETMGAGAPPAAADSDRRTRKRVSFERKVPAFGKRALRVLVGRDLSVEGMRVERFPGLELGDRLHLAIYGSHQDEEPFLIWATVERDDGENGIALTFDALPGDVAQRLESLVTDLPAVESLHDDECRAMGTVVSEILER